MSSIITHLYLANCMKNEFNFSDKFLTGALLPDILKASGEKRDYTHYIKKVEQNNRIFYLPNLKEYASKNPDLLKNEIKLGYFSHLVQDKIWFKYFIPKFTSYEDIALPIKYNDGSLHEYNEYLKDIYGDYALLDTQLLNNNNFKINNKLKNSLVENLPNKNLKETLLNNLNPQKIISEELKLIKNNQMDSYLEISKKETKHILTELLK